MTSVIPTVIRVASKPAPLGATGNYFDGFSGQAHPARLHIDEAAQVLVIEWTGGSARWPLSDIHLVPDQAEQGDLVLAVNGDPLARLITDEMLIAARCPALHRPVVKVSRWRIATWAIAAIASVALIILVLVPKMADQLAGFIPPKGEQALGAVTLERVRAALDKGGSGLPFCTRAQGVRALDDMVVRLTRGSDIQVPLNVHVLRHPMVNAFALPGGHIVLFDGLIQAAETPEELAAVVAHEIGHVVSRDPTRHALRSAGSIGVLGLLFGDFAGGALVLFMTEQLIEARYSQAAETDADTFAHSALIGSGVSPAALGDMFDRFLQLYGDSDGVVAHFLSHPELEKRVFAARAAVPAGFQADLLISDAQWYELQQICR